MTRFSAAYKAFNEPGLVTDPLYLEDVFADFDQRRLRYAIFWNFYQNTAYRDINRWAREYKTRYGLYRYIRNVYNPAYRLGEFWKSHLWGGQLDAEAGDGKEEPSALPILTDNESLRPSIAQLWQWSGWQVNKDIATLHGSIFGDVVLQVVDDAPKEKVFIRLRHPGTIKDVEVDDYGNVKGYTIQEERANPGKLDQAVTYTETAEREGDNVVYRTFLNDVPYPWNGEAAEWVQPYGFIPMVIIQHNNVGLDWGWSELQPLRSRIHEVDDLASKLDDQIRKTVDAPWLFAGVSKPAATPVTAETPLTGAAAYNRPEPGREEIPALYGPLGATATPLIAPLQIDQVAAHIQDLLADIEENHPELRLSKTDREASGERSGKALREARRDVANKVHQRRAGYDDSLVRIQQMAVAIAGWRGYDDFRGFGLDSYSRGDLDHAIGERPVFANDPVDDLEQLVMKVNILSALRKAGAGLEAAAIAAGLDEETARALEASKEPVPAALLAFGQQSGQQDDESEEDEDEPGNTPESIR